MEKKELIAGLQHSISLLEGVAFTVLSHRHFFLPSIILHFQTLEAESGLLNTDLQHNKGGWYRQLSKREESSFNSSHAIALQCFQEESGLFQYQFEVTMAETGCLVSESRQ